MTGTRPANPCPRKVDIMLYWLIALSDRLSVLNVFRYLTFRAVGAVVTALIFVFLFGPTIINLLRIKRARGSRSAPTGRNPI
jgi:hypothetical protein